MLMDCFGQHIEVGDKIAYPRSGMSIVIGTVYAIEDTDKESNITVLVEGKLRRFKRHDRCAVMKVHIGEKQ